MATITGTDRHDFLSGTNGPDTISGLGGGDLINGNGGADRIDGGTGPDDIFWNLGDGNDLVDGGPGRDTAFFDTTGVSDRTWRVEPGTAFSEVVFSGPGGTAVTMHEVESLFIQGGDGNDRFVLGDLSHTSLESFFPIDIHTGGGHDLVDGRGSGVPVFAVADAGNAGTVFLGGSGGDDFHGGIGADRLIGGAGDDFLDAGKGHDFLDGGDGSDDLTVSAGKARVVTGTGTDTVTVQPPVAGHAGQAEVTDFDPGHDGVSVNLRQAPDYALLDSDGNGRLDAHDATVKEVGGGLQVDLAPILAGRGDEVLTFDHLHSLPLDAFV